MNHLFVTMDYPPDLGGMARRHAELCRRLGPGRVVVSTLAAPGAAALDAAGPCVVRRQPFDARRAKLLVNQARWSGSLVADCRAEAIDVIHCGNIRPCGYAVLVARARTRLPVFVYVNGADLLRERRFVARPGPRRWTARLLLGGAAGVVANSAWTAALAEDYLRTLGIAAPPPVAAIELGTDPAQFSPARDRGGLRARLGLGEGPVLLTVARLVPHKGQDLGIRLTARLAAEFPGLRYLLVGAGHDEGRLRGLAAHLRVADRVVFAGALPDDELAEAYATATLYLGLSRLANVVDVEGFGISFVEAAASGVPSVAGDSGGVRAAVRDGETGLVVPPDDLAAAAEAVRRLLADAALRRRLGAAARRAAETHYTWDRVARETQAFVARCLARR